LFAVQWYLKLKDVHVRVCVCALNTEGLLRLAVVEMQLVMHFLDLPSLLACARAGRALYHAASGAFAWKFLVFTVRYTYGQSTAWLDVEASRAAAARKAEREWARSVDLAQPDINVDVSGPVIDLTHGNARMFPAPIRAPVDRSPRTLLQHLHTSLLRHARLRVCWVGSLGSVHDKTHATPAELEELWSFPRVTELDARVRPAKQDEWRQRLIRARWPHLERLLVQGAWMHEVIACACNLPRLHTLSIDAPSRRGLAANVMVVNASSFYGQLHLLPALTQLRVCDIPHRDYSVFLPVLQCPHLRRLDLGICAESFVELMLHIVSAGDASAPTAGNASASTAAFPALMMLRHLKVDMNWPRQFHGDTQNALETLTSFESTTAKVFAMMAQLHTVHFSQPPPSLIRALLNVLTVCGQLRRLFLCTRDALSPSAVVPFLDACPTLELLELRAITQHVDLVADEQPDTPEPEWPARVKIVSGTPAHFSFDKANVDW